MKQTWWPRLRPELVRPSVHPVRSPGHRLTGGRGQLRRGRRRAGRHAGAASLVHSASVPILVEHIVRGRIRDNRADRPARIR
jgi:hypothetical protein